MPATDMVTDGQLQALTTRLRTALNARSTAITAEVAARVAAIAAEAAARAAAIAANSTADRAYSDAADDVHSTADRAYSDSADDVHSTADRAYADTQDDSHSTADRAYADTQDDAHSTADRAYTDGEVSTVQGSIDAHLADPTDAHDASAVSYDFSVLSPLSLAWFASQDDVQTAITQIVAEIDGRIEAGDVDALITAINSWTEGNVQLDNPDVFESELIVARVLAAGAVVAGKVAADAIQAGNVAADAITAREISVEELSAINSNLGTITGGSLTIGPGAPFQVTELGELTAMNATIKGDVTAESLVLLDDEGDDAVVVSGDTNQTRFDFYPGEYNPGTEAFIAWSTPASAGSDSAAIVLATTADAALSGGIYDGSSVIQLSNKFFYLRRVNADNETAEIEFAAGGSIDYTAEAHDFVGPLNQPAAPTAGNHLTNKTYVDGKVAALESIDDALFNAIANLQITKSGSVNVTTDANGRATISYGYTFLSTPNVVACLNTGNANFTTVLSIGTTSFVVQINAGTAPLGSGFSRTVQWIATT